MDIQIGDIILVRGRTPIISSLIRWFTESEYTHVGIAVGKNLIYEIDIDKEMGLHPNAHKDFDIFRYKYHLTEKQKQKMKEYAIYKANINRGYDWLRVIGFALEKIFKTPFVFDAVNRKVCSEIVDIIYASVGIDLLPDRVDGHVTPGHIANSPFLYKVEQRKEKVS